MENNHIILKILYLTIILSVIFKNSEQILPTFLDMKSIHKNLNITPAVESFPNNIYKSFYKYLIILFIAFVISFIVFYSTYKIITFVKNINNSNNEEFDINYNIIPDLNLKIEKINNQDNETKVDNQDDETKVDNQDDETKVDNQDNKIKIEYKNK